MDNNGMGCAWGSGITIMIVVLAALAFGAPILDSGGLSWDNSATIARLNTQQATNLQDNITKRQESDNWHATAQQFAVAGAIVGVVAMQAWSATNMVKAWSARPHRPAQTVNVQITYAQAQRIAAQYIASVDGTLEQEEDGSWVVVSHRLRTVRTVASLLADGENSS